MSKFYTLKVGSPNLVNPPTYGKQHIGVSPKGANDRTTYTMMSEAFHGVDFECSTAHFTNTLTVLHDCVMMFGGATTTVTNVDKDREIPRGISTVIAKGTHIHINTPIKGTFVYIFASKFEKICNVRKTITYNEGWRDPLGYIRVRPGPEYNLLSHTNSLCNGHWKTSKYMDSMGIRLESDNTNVDLVDHPSMISAPVSDGTIQITPTGPIILMRHRQTIGGYPRAYYVIEADIDILAQYAPNQLLKFKLISADDERCVNVKKWNMVKLSKVLMNERCNG